MRIGIQLAFGDIADPGELRDTVLALEEHGVAYLHTGGHVLSAEAGRYPERAAPSYAGVYRDPFALFSYLAALTSRMHFRTSVLILPLFPTALVARQAADLAWLSGGRFELGVGISWQEAEFRALGQPMLGRARRMEHQIELLRRFWSEPFVRWHDEYHDVDGVGLNTLPPPIPIWLGNGSSELLLRRVARLGDGWLPLGGLDSAAPIDRLRDLAREAGRDPASIGVAGRALLTGDGPKACAEAAVAQKAIGVSDLTISVQRDVGLSAIVDALGAVRSAIG